MAETKSKSSNVPHKGTCLMYVQYMWTSATGCYMFACHFSQVEARNTIHNTLGQLSFGSSEVCVRINSIETGLAEDDLRAILTAKAFPQSIVLPKVETMEHLDWVKAHISQVNHFVKVTVYLQGEKFSIGEIASK